MIKRWTKRSVYVVLLCVALIAASYAIYNQYTSDNNTAELANQVAKACAENNVLAEHQGLNCGQARELKDSAPRGAPPVSWTWKDPSSNVTFICVRSNSDDNAPTYACK